MEFVEDYGYNIGGSNAVTFSWDGTWCVAYLQITVTYTNLVPTALPSPLPTTPVPSPVPTQIDFDWSTCPADSISINEEEADTAFDYLGADLYMTADCELSGIDCDSMIYEFDDAWDFTLDGEWVGSVLCAVCGGGGGGGAWVGGKSGDAAVCTPLPHYPTTPLRLYFTTPLPHHIATPSPLYFSTCTTCTTCTTCSTGVLPGEQ